MKNIKKKQKLDRRDTYGNASQIRVPLQNGVLEPLNRERTLSVPGLKTLFNNPCMDTHGNAAGTGTERFHLSFLQIFFKFLPLKRCGVLEAIR